MDPIPVEVFLESFPPPIRAAAEALRGLIRRIVPDADEMVRPGWGVIGYNVPVRRGAPYIGGVFPQQEHCHLLLEQGVLLADPNHLLEGAGVTKRVRWLTFNRPADVTAQADAIVALLQDAVRVAAMSRGERQLLAMDRGA